MKQFLCCICIFISSSILAQYNPLKITIQKDTSNTFTIDLYNTSDSNVFLFFDTDIDRGVFFSNNVIELRDMLFPSKDTARYSLSYMVTRRIVSRLCNGCSRKVIAIPPQLSLKKRVKFRNYEEHSLKSFMVEYCLVKDYCTEKFDEIAESTDWNKTKYILKKQVIDLK